MTNLLNQIFFILLNRFGPQNWWPAESKFEIIVGAILTQNTSWKNVEKAISKLKEKDLLCPKKINSLSHSELSELIKSAGFFNIKSKRLKNLINFLEKYQFDLKKIKSLENLRDRLLEVEGIGKETADSILLYVFDQPVFVVDAYTKRIFSRLGFLEEESSYDDFQSLFHNNLTRNAEFFGEYHALIVKHAKEYCRKKPQCTQCPINHLCYFYKTAYGQKI